MDEPTSDQPNGPAPEPNGPEPEPDAAAGATPTDSAPAGAPVEPALPPVVRRPVTGNETIRMPAVSLPPWTNATDDSPAATGPAQPSTGTGTGTAEGASRPGIPNPSPGWPAAGQPPLPPPAGDGPVADLPPPVPITRRRRPAAIVGAIVGVAVIGAGAAFAITQLAGDEGNSPEEAMQALLSAVQKGDAIGIAEAMAPGERDVLLESGVPMIEQLKRLELLDPGLDLKKVPGYKAQFTDVRMSTRQLRDDLVAVRLAGGQVVSSVDPQRLPIGSFFRNLVGDDLSSATSTPDQSSSIPADDETEFVTLKRDGKWYVSLGYSIALAGTGSVPTAASAIPAVGADSPDAAIRDLLDAAASLDVRRVVQLMDPEEMGALHDYAGQFVPDAEQAVAEVRNQYRITFPGLELATAQNGGTATVKIRKIGIDASLQTTDAAINARVSYIGNCLSVTVDNETHKRCGRDIPKLVEDLGGEPLPADALDQFNKSLDQQRKGVNPDIGFVVVRRDGKWFVSPMRTMLQAGTRTLEKIQRSDLDEVKKFIDDIQDGSLDDTSGNPFGMFS